MLGSSLGVVVVCIGKRTISFNRKDNTDTLKNALKKASANDERVRLNGLVVFVLVAYRQGQTLPVETGPGPWRIAFRAGKLKLYMF